MEMHKRLYRSTKSKVLGGVAGGIAEYFDIDPILIRLLFVIIAFAGGGGVLVYLIMWIAIPLEPFTSIPFQQDAAQPGSAQEANAASMPEGSNMPTFKSDKRSGLIGGLLLISLGLIFLAARFIPHINFGDLWPLLLVVLGGVLIATSLSDRVDKQP